MHQQGFIYCKRCFQFYKLSNGQHDCERTKSLNNSTDESMKLDDFTSLEQLIPPETSDQHDFG